MSNRSPTVEYRLLATFNWHQYVVLSFPLVWNQAAEGPPCSAGFGPGCRERSCAAGPTCTEQTEQQQVQGGSNWRFRWWSHREHHWVATSTRWVLPVCCYPLAQLIPYMELLNPLNTFSLPVNWLPALETAFSHFCKEAVSALKWQELLRLRTEPIKWLGKKMTVMYLPSVVMIISIKH